MHCVYIIQHVFLIDEHVLQKKTSQQQIYQLQMLLWPSECQVKNCTYVITITGLALFCKSKNKQAYCMYVCERLKHIAGKAAKLSDMRCCYSPVSVVLQTAYCMYYVSRYMWVKMCEGESCACVCAVTKCMRPAHPGGENKHHRHSVRVSGCVSVCLCMCVKPDNPEPVPSTKFTSVLTELSGLPSQSGGDRQCISSLSY